MDSRHNIKERLDELYRRLNTAPTPGSAEDAFEQHCRILEEVEDELSGIPKKTPPPAPGESDGRMYPPFEDNVVRHSSGAITARTRCHVVEISPDGHLTIRNKRTGTTEFVR